MRRCAHGIGNIVYVLTGLLASSAAAWAQQSHSDSGQLEEVVVTAEKRESTVQSTPISLTAVSGTDIQERGVTDLASLVQSVPGVTLRSSGAGMAEFEMRGVSSTGGNSPTVGFYFDDTPLTAPAAAIAGKIVLSPALYDLARVEVLRGPQGTLYGSGSMGGTIKVVPNAPNPSAFASSAELVFGDTQGGGFNHAENAMVNLPFGSGFGALRIVGSYSHDSGWIDRIVTQPGTFPLPVTVPTLGTVRGDVQAAPVAARYRDVNDVARAQVRISALLKPLEGLDITPSILYQRMAAGGLPYIDSNPGTNAHYQPFDVSEAYRDEFKLLSLTARYHTDAFEVSSTTAYWNRHEPLVQDATESWSTALGLTSYTAGAGGLGRSYAYENLKSHQTTEELRIQSVGDSKLNWLLGYFYQDFESFWDIDFPSQGGGALFGDNDLFYYFSPSKVLQQSVFGEVTWRPLERLALTAGLRRYHYNAPVGVHQVGSLIAPADAYSAERDQGVTPKVSISYDLSPDLLVYATAAKGFRPGGGTGPVPTSGPLSCEAQLQQERGTTQFVAGPITFGSDHVWSYELGEKFRTADRRLTVNASAYFLSWIGVQQTDALSSCGYQYTTNAGNAHVYGGELEVQAAVTRELTVSASTAYTHATLVSAALNSPNFPPGTPIQDVAKWTALAFIVYRHPLNEALTLAARAENTYVGSRIDQTYSLNNLPSYDLANGRVGVEADRWSAFFFVNNLGNKRAFLTDAIYDAANIPTVNRIAVPQPRTFGVDLSYRFAP